METNNETLVQKFERLRNSIPYIKVESPKVYAVIAEKKYSEEKLTANERTELINIETNRLHNKAILERNDYLNEINKVNQQWQKELFEEFGVTGNPKAKLCYDLAYEHGHSSGYSEIYNYFSDFVELIK